MSDRRLRELGRESARDVDVESKAKHLRERVRTGDLDPEMLSLAAYCGDEAARLVAGWPKGRIPVRLDPGDGGVEPYYGWRHIATRNFSFWLRGLSHGDEAPIRAALAAARASLPRMPRVCLGPGSGESLVNQARALEHKHERARTALEAVEAWVESPCDERARACGEKGTTLDPCSLLAFYVGAHGSWEPKEKHGEWRHVVLEAVRLVGKGGETTVRGAICEELIEWALRGR